MKSFRSMALWAWSTRVLVAGICGSASTVYQPALLGRIRARYLVARLPNPPVRPVRETFASYGSRERDIMGNVHFASSTEHSPWTALRVRWVPLYRFPTLSLRALPKPRCRHLDSATKPDMNVSVHPAAQQRGVCHTYLGEAR